MGSKIPIRRVEYWKRSWRQLSKYWIDGIPRSVPSGSVTKYVKDTPLVDEQAHRLRYTRQQAGIIACSFPYGQRFEGDRSRLESQATWLNQVQRYGPGVNKIPQEMPNVNEVAVDLRNADRRARFKDE